MGVLLINPYIYHSNLGTISPWDVPSLGLAYLASCLEENNLKVEIIDAHIEQLSHQKILSKIRSKNIEIIGITANGYSAKYALVLSKKIKKAFPDILLVMGGPFVTSQYQILLMQRYCDVCVLGEGEETFVELVQNSANRDSWSEIKGICFLKDNKLMITEKRPLINNIDNIPFPAWHLFPPLKKYKNLRGITQRPYLPIITSRGCPYSCNWCTKSIHGYKFRARSPENVVEEMAYMQRKYHIKEFIIMDDCFSLNELRLKKICVLIKRKNLHVIINLYNGIRADTINESMLQYLRALGINRITVGVESGDQSIVKKIGKKLDLSDVLQAVKLCKKYRIIIDGFFILGHPYDTIQTMEKTIQFAINADFDHSYFFVAIPFPGTMLYDIVQKEAFLMSDVSKGLDHHIVEGIPVYYTKNFSADQLRKKYKEAYRRFYFRPKKIFSLGMIYFRLIIRYFSIELIKWIISQTLHLIRTKLEK